MRANGGEGIKYASQVLSLSRQEVHEEMTLPQPVLRMLNEKAEPLDTPGFGKIVFHGEISYLDGAIHRYHVWAHDEETRKG